MPATWNRCCGGIEKDPLLRQTMTAVLILDRPPDRETLLDRLERASRTIPAGDQTVYLAGAKVVALYPFGPLMGTAANCCLLGYDHRAYVGINADAAAVPDLDMLAGCIREGFDALIALADVG